MWPCSSQMALTLRMAKGKALLSGLFKSCVAVFAASACGNIRGPASSVL